MASLTKEAVGEADSIQFPNKAPIRDILESGLFFYLRTYFIDDQVIRSRVGYGAIAV